MQTLVHMMVLILMISSCEKKTLLRIKHAVVSEEVPNHTVKEESVTTETKSGSTDATETEPVKEESKEEPRVKKQRELSTDDGKQKYELAVEAVKAKDFETATPLYLEACNAGEMRGCHRYGYHQQKQGKNDIALQYYTKACEGGVGKACNNLGWLLEKQGNHAEAQNWYSWACLKSHPGSCPNLRRVEDRAKSRLAH